VDTLSASLQANCLSTMKKERYSPNAAPFQPRSSSMVDISAQVELHEVFDYLGLSKYTTVFLQQEVNTTKAKIELEISSTSKVHFLKLICLVYSLSRKK